jgi:hypothetical protein
MNHPDAVKDNEKKEYCTYGANYISWDIAEVAAATEASKHKVQANLYAWHQCCSSCRSSSQSTS